MARVIKAMEEKYFQESRDLVETVFTETVFVTQRIVLLLCDASQAALNNK